MIAPSVSTRTRSAPSNIPGLPLERVVGLPTAYQRNGAVPAGVTERCLQLADFWTRVAVAPGGDVPGDFGEGLN